MAQKLISTVAQTLRDIRKDQGLSQEALAEKAGLDRTYISGVERGVRNITLESLEQIVLALDLDCGTFLAMVAEGMK